MKRKPVSSVGSPNIKPMRAAVATVLGAGIAASSAWAQDDPLAEIVVTASRRATSVLELPFNFRAVSGRTLERQRLTSLNEFSRWVPGLTVVDQGARAGNLMTVRGLNVTSLNGSEFLDNSSGGTVATYLGEIPLYVDLKMKDIDRVEVLIGPQGTLYGAGTLGGAVRYIPNAPDMDEFLLEVHGDAFSLAESDGLGYEADLVVNAPIIEGKLAFRGSFSYLDDPGFIDYSYLVREPGVSDPEPDMADPAAVAANLYGVEDANTERTHSTRLSLLWAVSDAVQATFNYYFQDQQAGARTINHRDAFDTGPYESAHRFLEPNDRENSLVSMEIVADLGFAELTSATGFSSYDELGQRDQTDLLLDFEYGYETFPSFAAYTREIAEEQRFNQELRLVSTGTSPLSWIAGIYHHEYELDSTSEEFTPGIPEYWGIDLPTGDLEYLQLTQKDFTEQAFFGELSYAFTARLDVAVGGRWFDYDTDKLVAFDIPFIAYSDEQSNVAEDDGFLGKINASYAFSDNVTGYATLSEGYRIGGINSVAPCAFPLPAGQNICALPDEILIEPDRTTNFELGVHSMLNDGRTFLNAAIYTIDWDDIQTESTTENGAVPITVNGGKAESQGLELSFQTTTASGWGVGGSYAFNQTELTTDAPGLVDGVDAFAGDRVAGTPEHQASLFLSHARTLANGLDLDVAYGLTATSDIYTKVGLRNDGEVLGGYTLHHASVGLGRDRWQATLYADNLTNKFAETAVRQDPTFVRDVADFSLRRYFRNVIRPRTVGIEFRYSLGE